MTDVRIKDGDAVVDYIHKRQVEPRNERAARKRLGGFICRRRRGLHGHIRYRERRGCSGQRAIAEITFVLIAFQKNSSCL